MIFSSLQYLIFLPIVAVLYWRAQGQVRLWLLVAASYFFYMSWMPIYGLLLLGMSLFNWLLGLGIEKTKTTSQKTAKGLLIFGLLANLASLCYYKYSNFILANLALLLGQAGKSFDLAALQNINAPILHIILPLGISFFVFEFIHYLVDVYNGNKALSSWLKFAAFAAFFPSQIAGPIKRYQDFVEKMDNPLPWSKELFAEGMTLILQGMFKKIAIADPLGNIIAPAYNSAQALSSLDATIAAFGFAVQIFCDFSGYTDIGRGSALLLGIRLPINFNLPYIASDLAQFWRRWHMSLSFWIRDYVYIPLGGSKVSRGRNLWNLFATMTVCGLWHGAAWQFILWGSAHGLGLIVNRLWRDLLESLPAKKIFEHSLVQGINILLTFVFVTMAFVMFRAASLGQAANIWLSLFNTAGQSICLEPMLKSGVLVFALVYMGFWIVCDLLKYFKPQVMNNLLINSAPLRLGAWTAAVLLIIAAKPVEATPFIYFQF
ncbi:MAG: hypothetical protein K2W82_12530 [Candidatus Obscuribacterales bacterium]|nr:hypothetical protein [Candidatus Obscuribacterales bacterium]